MNFDKCKEKYFVIVEGEERATIRESLAAAEKKRKKLAKYSQGKKIFISRRRKETESQDKKIYKMLESLDFNFGGKTYKSGRSRIDVRL